MSHYATEHAEQVALFRAVAWHARTRPELELLFAIPNGGHRHIAVAGKLKAEGVKRGVPDLFLPVARGAHHGLFIEMKTRAGRASPIQRQWIADLHAQGYRVEVCRGADAAWAVIDDYLSTQGAK